MTIRRALLSVSDKTGLVPFARALSELGVELLSTGGTYRALSDAGIAVSSVESYTGSPEVMDGRVKTLHPRVHGALLARAGTDDADLERIGALPIDLVVVNLYPFEQTLAKPGASFAELIENIDIGGPSMLRSAAKNHSRVTVVCDPADYDAVISELREHSSSTGDETRQQLAAKVFAHTASYDAAIATWLSTQGEADGHPRSLFFCLDKAYGLRYGENPHQKGAFYRERKPAPGSLAAARGVGAGAKELSFNNLVDAEAALDAVRDFSGPAAVVIKHASPCGIAVADSLPAAYHAAREADAMSAFGGIVAVNRAVDLATAEIMAETFIECIIAPSFDAPALERLRKKKALRLLATSDWLPADHEALHLKRVGGGMVVQDRDRTGPGEVNHAKCVTRRAASATELAALEFAWTACKHVKSNAIVLASANQHGFTTVGIGGGQTARVSAVRQAVEAAQTKAKGSVMASDAFFPFPDGIEAAAKAGVTAIAQPGGSKADSEVIAAADAADVAMLFTSVRHFRH